MTVPSHALKTGEELIPASQELLFRQVTDPMLTPSGDQPSSQAFGPMPIDAGRPSFARERETDPQASRDWHNRNAKKPSRGVWACSSSEVEKAGSVSVYDFDTSPTTLPPGHSYVDYRGLDRPTRRELASLLLAKALERKELPTTA